MKNKLTKESMFKKKGFYVALYTTVGVALIGVAVYSFTSLEPQREILIPDDTRAEVDFDNLTTVNQNSAKSYLTPDDRENQVVASEKPSEVPKTNSEQPKENEKNPTSKLDPAEKSKPEEEKAPVKDASETNIVKPTEAPKEQEVPARVPEPAKKPQEQSVEDSEKNEVSVGEDENFYSSYVPTEEELRLMKQFEEGSKMTRPLVGDIVMDYSGEKLIYDKTLEQYRTNKDLKISAEVGTQVKAAAEGRVLKIGKTREDGNIVEISHGNGWVTTYSQLQDKLLVNIGDLVTEGQVIGGVNEPTIYNVLLGNHLSFSVAKGEEYIDPKSMFVE